MQIPRSDSNPEGSGADAEVRFRGLGEVLEGSGADICVRFWKVPVQMRKLPVQWLGQVPQGCGAHTQVRLRKVPVQSLGEVPDGSGADPR